MDAKTVAPAVVPLGDQAVLAYFADEEAALRFAAAVRQAPPAWLIDVVPAYTSVGLYFDLEQVDFAQVAAEVRRWSAQASSSPLPGEGEGRVRGFESRHHRIPCCYELGQDIVRIACHTGLSIDEVIRLHVETEYTIYAIGFCPGFPYMGYLPAPLCGVPRLATPRLHVEAGSVGLAARQTGVYTEPRPGGWNLIGKTPLELVHVADGYFPLRTGDRVRFERIDEGEYQRRLGERLKA